MSKEQIIEIMQKHWHQDGYYTASFDGDGCVNELFATFEQDKIGLLKEFVEYLQSTGKYQALCEDIDSRGISWGKRYMSANHQLDRDLKKFLEEKNENNIKNN